MTDIVLIEDDTTMRENISEILELANYKVESAVNGRDGSALVKKLKPRLVLCDIMMAGLDGYGVLHVLTKDPETASIPFIFLSAKAEKSEYRKGMDLGADDYITKPFEDTELLNAVEARLQKQKTIQSALPPKAAELETFLDQARSAKNLSELSKLRAPSVYKKKEILFHTGDNPQYLFFIVKGKVKTYKTHDDGKEYITNVYRDGDFFGHASLLYNHVYSASALTLEESEICKIPKEDFLSLMYSNREISDQFIKMLSNEIEEQEKNLLRLAYDSVRKRAAESLLTLNDKYNNPGQNGPIIISRDDLASLSGTVTETVTRCLSEFKEDNYIKVHGRDITITNPAGLKSIQ